MKDSELTDEELANIKSMQHTFDKDYLLVCSKVKGNSMANVERLAEYQASEFSRNGPDLMNNGKNGGNGANGQSGARNGKKNVSFATQHQEINLDENGNQKMSENDEMLNELNHMFNQSSIPNRNQDQNNASFVQDHQGPQQPNAQGGNASFRSHVNVSTLLQDPFKENPQIEMNMELDIKVQETLMHHMARQGQTGPAFQDVHTQKAKLDSRRSKYEILTMQKEVETSVIQNSTFEAETGDNYPEESYRNQMVDEKECQLCLEEQFKGDYSHMNFKQEALALNCMHKAHTVCILNSIVKSDSSQGFKCFSCREPLSGQDILSLNEFVIKNYNSFDLDQFITENKSRDTWI